jgi:hypothetical protein
MIHCEPDFFNKVVAGIETAYFPDEERWRNPKYQKTKYAIELFNNGCINYRTLIGRVAKGCGTTNLEIHTIIEKHITSFGEYT